jgi:NAD(P)-dependent dehydrogenase (short-subunit alcohol dehydrogenase family)
MTDMTGKVALITGASSGIGSATAAAFAARGCKVALAARRENELAQLVKAIEARGGSAKFIKTDVSVAEDVRRMVDQTMSAFGRLDYAVNNAGIEGNFFPIEELPEEEWDRILDINLKGVYLCLKYEAKAMLPAGRGAIVNVGSVNSFRGFPMGSAYVASKHALIGLTSSVSAELGPRGIRVNLVCPGLIDTPMHRRLRATIGDAPFDAGVLPRVHVQRAGRAEEIASAILFLCSDEASYITGTTLTPDGGFTLTL